MSLSRKTVSIERRLRSLNIEYNFKWNQPYLGRVSNLSRGSSSLNLASVRLELVSFKIYHLISHLQIWFCLTKKVFFLHNKYTVRTRKQWNRKTTLLQYLFDVFTKQIVLLDTGKIANLV